MVLKAKREKNYQFKRKLIWLLKIMIFFNFLTVFLFENTMKIFLIFQTLTHFSYSIFILYLLNEYRIHRIRFKTLKANLKGIKIVNDLHLA